MQDQSKSLIPAATPKYEPVSLAPSLLTRAELAKVSGAGLVDQQAPHSSW